MAITVNRLLLAYCVGMTTVLAAVATTQAVSEPARPKFDQIDVHRINVREADGTLRMVISNSAEAPGAIVKGHEYPHPSRSSAGMIFFNDEGTENGGLIFGGATGKDGKVSGYGHLSFDQYESDQVINLEQSESDGQMTAGLGINDYPFKPLDFARLSRLESMPDGPARTAEIAALKASGDLGARRLFIGKKDGASMLTLKDAKGRDRLRLSVTPGGEAAIQFLDEAGKVTRTVTPAG